MAQELISLKVLRWGDFCEAASPDEFWGNQAAGGSVGVRVEEFFHTEVENRLWKLVDSWLVAGKWGVGVFEGFIIHEELIVGEVRE